MFFSTTPFTLSSLVSAISFDEANPGGGGESGGGAAVADAPPADGASSGKDSVSGSSGSPPAVPTGDRPAITQADLDRISGEHTDDDAGASDGTTAVGDQAKVEPKTGEGSDSQKGDSSDNGQGADPLARLDEYLADDANANVDPDGKNVKDGKDGDVVADDKSGTGDTTGDTGSKPTDARSQAVAQVKSWSENPEHAEEAVSFATAAYEMDQALQKGDISGALNYLAPESIEKITRHLFEANRDKFADWYVDGTDNKSGTAGKNAPAADSINTTSAIENHPVVKQLRDELARLTGKVDGREQREQQDARDLKVSNGIRDRQQKVSGYWDALFEKSGVEDQDVKDMLSGWTMRVIANDPDARKAVGEGKLHPIGLKFREVFSKHLKQNGGAAANVSGNGNGNSDNAENPPSDNGAETSIIGDLSDKNFDEDEHRRGFLRRHMSRVFGDS